MSVWVNRDKNCQLIYYQIANQHEPKLCLHMFSNYFVHVHSEHVELNPKSPYKPSVMNNVSMCEPYLIINWYLDRSSKQHNILNEILFTRNYQYLRASPSYYREPRRSVCHVKLLGQSIILLIYFI